ncbi:MAG: hypothetical protein ACT4P4_03935 [Betaproteobacteria bacterium]
MSRLDAVIRFYEILDTLVQRNGGFRTLGACHGRMAWPERGVYFFFERGENRTDSGKGPRVVRIGTHALKNQSRTTLWKRLSQHAGRRTSGGGNHRGSIFRLLIGEAIRARNGAAEPRSWGIGAHRGDAAARLGLGEDLVRTSEAQMEIEVSRYICELLFLVLSVDDLPGPGSERGIIERGAIALLSNFGRPTIDAASDAWLGTRSGRERVRQSGLWNNNHVDEDWGPDWLRVFFAAVVRA